MAYKIPGLPTAGAYIEEIADFWEIESIRNPGLNISSRRISKTLGIGMDELNHEGIESEDDELDDHLEPVFQELERRISATRNRYPFKFTKYSIKSDEELDDPFALAYIYLILATRFNMNLDKTFNGIDGTKLFEKMCSDVLKNYFGENADAYVLGTAIQGNFEDKVNQLTTLMKEGGKFRNSNPGRAMKNEDGVDVVAWKNFSDDRPGKIIAFAQCKTGTESWRDGRHKLKPLEFCQDWFSEQPVYTPLKFLCITDTMNLQRHFISDQRGFIVFNRFRILELLKLEENNLLKEITTWTTGALEKIRV